MTRAGACGIGFAILAVLLVFALPARAAPVSMTAPSTLNFNFDLTGSTPGPPFGLIEIFPGWGELSPGDAFSAAFFPELNSQGTSSGSCLGHNSSCSFDDASFTDGTFSMSAEALLGQFTVEPGAIALTPDFRLVPLSGSPPPPTALSTGQTVVFNFDLTGIGPLGAIKIYPGLAGFSIPAAFSVDFFTEADGQGPLLASCSDYRWCELTDPSFTDGVFSIGVNDLFGTFTAQPGVIGLTANFALAGSTVFGTVRSVPEPDTPVLLGLALAGLLLSRRGKRH